MASSSAGSSEPSRAMAPRRTGALGGAASGEWEWECECKQKPEWDCKCQCGGEQKREQRQAGLTNWEVCLSQSTVPIPSLFHCSGSPLVCPFAASDDAEPRSLRYFHKVVSDPSQGLGQINISEYMNCKLLKYDSKTQRKKRRASSVAANTDQQYLDRQTEISQEKEQIIRGGLETLCEHYSKSSGSHTVQCMYGCDLFKNGSIRVLEWYSSDGKDSLTSDEDKQTYTEAYAEDQITKTNCEEYGSKAEQMKCRMDKTCIEILSILNTSGKDTQGRGYAAPGCKKEQGQCRELSLAPAATPSPEHPKVQVSGMEANKILTLSCRTYGPFSPEPQSNLIPIIAGVAVIVVAVITALAGFAVWKRKQGKKGKGYNVAPGSEGGSSCSTTGSNLSV